MKLSKKRSEFPQYKVALQSTRAVKPSQAGAGMLAQVELGCQSAHRAHPARERAEPSRGSEKKKKTTHKPQHLYGETITALAGAIRPARRFMASSDLNKEMRRGLLERHGQSVVLLGVGWLGVGWVQINLTAPHRAKGSVQGACRARAPTALCQPPPAPAQRRGQRHLTYIHARKSMPPLIWDHHHKEVFNTR